MSRTLTSHQYVYDDLGRQIYEKQTVDSRQTLAYYTYGYGMQARRVNQTNNYLHSDILGSITAITNSSGSALGTYEYDPCGILLSSSTNLGNFAFTGQEIDFETNLYHFPARYYEPYWGRFLTADPYTNLPDDARNFVYQSYIEKNNAYYKRAGIKTTHNIPLSPVPQIHNLYPYTANNPVNLLDPKGLGLVLPSPVPPSCIECQNCYNAAGSYYEESKQRCEQNLRKCLNEGCVRGRSYFSFRPAWCYIDYAFCLARADDLYLTDRSLCNFSMACIQCTLWQTDQIGGGITPPFWPFGHGSLR